MHACRSTLEDPTDVPALTSLSFSSSATNLIHTLLDSTCGGTALQCAATSPLTRTNLAAGTYYYVVDGKTTAATTFTVNVAGKIADGASCEGQLANMGVLTCGTGLTCKGTAGARTCQRAQCSDGMDNNGNGKMDYPADPGCDSPADDTETTVCPGASCPQCSDGMDNDGDTRIDYPMDTSCFAASGDNESCVTSEPVAPIVAATTTGATTTATDDGSYGTCDSSSAAGKDVIHSLTVPALTTMTFTLTTPWDAVAVLLDSTCGGTALSCSDTAPITRTNVAAGTYYYVVDAWSSASGTYSFTFSGKVADNGSCESPLFAAGALTCATTGYVCGGTAGSRTCRAPQCSDGIDNNGSGGTDFPNDPGCTSPIDATEDTVTCPGSSCPQCANTTDDDADSLIDYPMDYGCAGRGSNSEEFCELDLDFGGVVNNTLMQNTLATATPDVQVTCSGLANGKDVTYALQLPVPVATLVIDTAGSASDDTLLEVRDAACGVVFACNDDGPSGVTPRSRVTMTNVAAGNYAVTVKGYTPDMVDSGGFNLNTKGTVAPMTSCTSPLFAAGVLACPTGTTCSGAAGAQKCQ